MVLMCLCSRGSCQVQGEFAHHNWAAWKRQCRESVARVTAYGAIQRLLVIVETQTLKSVTSSIKVSDHRVNMEIFQNVRDSAGFAATSQP